MINYASAPEVVSWDVTVKCNLRCSHCYSSSCKENSFKEDLTTEQAFELIDELDEIGVFQLVLLGGEPFMRKDIMDIIDYAVNKNLHVGIATNGTLIDKKISKKLSQYSLNGVQVSLDSAYEEIHDNFRNVKGAFKKAIDGIRILSNDGNRVIVCSVISKINYNEIEEIVKIAVQNGAKEFRTIRYIPSGRGVKEFQKYAIDKKEAQIVRNTLENLKHKYESVIKVSTDHSMDFLKSSSLEFCSAGTTTCAIKHNGDVTPCSYINDIEYVCGNVKKEAFIDIWHRSKMHTFRDISKFEGKCKECRYLNSCKGGCRAAAIGLYGKANVQDPYCYI